MRLERIRRMCHCYIQQVAFCSRYGSRKFVSLCIRSRRQHHHQQPTVILVRRKAPLYQAVLVSIHGPDFPAYSREYIAEFWATATSDVKAAATASDTIVCCVDSSCRIARHDGPDDLIIGGILVPLWKSSCIEQAFVDFCRYCSLAVANTFDNTVFPDAHHGSLFVSTGVTIRADYVCVSLSARPEPHSLFAWDSFRMHSAKPDHIPISVGIWQTSTKPYLFVAGDVRNTTGSWCTTLTTPRIPMLFKRLRTSRFAFWKCSPLRATLSLLHTGSS